MAERRPWRFLIAGRYIAYLRADAHRSCMTSTITDDFRKTVRFDHRKHRFLGATQLLWAKLEQSAERVALLRLRATIEQQQILEQCQQTLELAKDQLDRFWKRPFAFWELIHQVDELLLLAVPDEMLAAEALDVKENFERKIQDRALVRAWLGDGRSGPLPEVVERLKGGPGNPVREQDRYLLRGALHIVNERTDKGFWFLGTNTSIQLASAVLLVGLFAAVFLLLEENRPLPGGGAAWPLDVWLAATAMLGAGGAIVSNMLAKEPFVLSVGPTARYFVYNLFAKPALGAFAAVFVYALAQSKILFEIVSSPPPAEQVPLRIVLGSTDTVNFALAVLAVAVGFSAERVLRSMMDKVLQRFFAESEKMATDSTASKAGRGIGR